MTSSHAVILQVHFVTKIITQIQKELKPFRYFLFFIQIPHLSIDSITLMAENR